MKQLFIVCICTIAISMFGNSCYSQDTTLIKFAAFAENSNGRIKLIATNKSNKRTIYYSIGVQGYSDTGWVHLTSNIDAIGQNDFLAFKPIKPHSRIVKYISRKEITNEYIRYPTKRIRFYIMFRETRQYDELRNDGIIFLSPIE
jgi:hypothetical protein